MQLLQVRSGSGTGPHRLYLVYSFEFHLLRAQWRLVHSVLQLDGRTLATCDLARAPTVGYLKDLQHLLRHLRVRCQLQCVLFLPNLKGFLMVTIQQYDDQQSTARLRLRFYSGPTVPSQTCSNSIAERDSLPLSIRTRGHRVPVDDRRRESLHRTVKSMHR